MIKKEDGKWVLYSKDGKKVLGRFDSEAAAKKREGEIKSFKNSDEGFAIEVESGKVVLVEGGRVDLCETDLGNMDDDELRGMRKLMVKKQGKINQEFMALGDDKYSTPEGNALLRDIGYYSNVLYRIENEMVYRLLTLD
jgi:hypothetical protein